MSRTRRLLRWVVCGREEGVRATLLRRVARCAGGVRTRDGTADAPRPHPKDPEIPLGFHPIIKVDELQPGGLLEVVVEGRALALACVDGAYFAVTDICPHAGGALGEGTLDGPTLTCPVHGWTFDVRDGACHVDPALPLETFEVRVIGGWVCVSPQPQRRLPHA